MKVLAINCGSSTLKFKLFETAGALGPLRQLALGSVDAIGEHATVEFTGSETFRKVVPVGDHLEATRQMLEWLGSSILLQPDGLGAVGHRVVHGGDRFGQPVLIDEEMLSDLAALAGLAPLHNAPALSTIRGVRSVLGGDIPAVAVFDTAFHRTLPPKAAHYAIPHELAAKHGIRRYGFHGIAHRYMVERYAALAGKPVDRVRLVTLQLGNGCSATAVDEGRSVDTSMGFTPLEGLVMGTRSGDVDPSLGGFLARQERADIAEVEDWFNRRSGLLGVSGSSPDMRKLQELETQGDARAALAVEMFCYRVRKTIGAYLAVLGGAEAVIFGGGIGENAPAVRARICTGMEWCGLLLDRDRNREATGTEARISIEGARIHAHVIPVDEGVIIARETIHLLQGRSDARRPSLEK
ncbi:MAG: acetate/propionate family kinase [Phycisphaerales bacterium]|nr:acetate/propionate family kinase [Phycisphaerales bacterium]